MLSLQRDILFPRALKTQSGTSEKLSVSFVFCHEYWDKVSLSQKYFKTSLLHTLHSGRFTKDVSTYCSYWSSWDIQNQKRIENSKLLFELLILSQCYFCKWSSFSLGYLIGCFVGVNIFCIFQCKGKPMIYQLDKHQIAWRFVAIVG